MGKSFTKALSNVSQSNFCCQSINSVGTYVHEYIVSRLTLVGTFHGLVQFETTNSVKLSPSDTSLPYSDHGK